MARQEEEVEEEEEERAAGLKTEDNARPFVSLPCVHMVTLCPLLQQFTLKVV